MVKNKNVLAILVIGAAAGAALGMLLSPDSGKNLREKISNFKDSVMAKNPGDFKKIAKTIVDYKLDYLITGLLFRKSSYLKKAIVSMILNKTASKILSKNSEKTISA